MVLDQLYNLSGVIVSISGFILLFVVLKTNKNKMRSRIFLKFDTFRYTFIILAASNAVFLIGNISGLLSHPLFHEIHELAEITFNALLMIFIITLSILFRTGKITKKSMNT